MQSMLNTAAAVPMRPKIGRPPSAPPETAPRKAGAVVFTAALILAALLVSSRVLVHPPRTPPIPPFAEMASPRPDALPPREAVAGMLYPASMPRETPAEPPAEAQATPPHAPIDKDDRSRLLSILSKD